MKLSNYFWVFSFLIFYFLPINLVFSAMMSPISNLKLGDYGEDVLALQKILNLDQDTKVADIGAGSPGNETKYFGKATEKAIVKFQEKYKDEVLIPANLSFGAGYVGKLTLKKLKFISQDPSFVIQNKLKNKDIYVESIISLDRNDNEIKIDNKTTVLNKPVGNFVEVPIKDKKTNIKISLTWDPKTEKNPNLENYDYSMSVINKVGTEQGYSKDDLLKVKKIIDEELATTTNLQALFVKENLKNITASVLPNDVFFSFINGPAKGFRKVISNISDFVLPKVEAQVGMDYGARILTSILCTCSANWLITLMPIGMGPTLLTHYSGAQSYMNFNVPFATYIIGKYQPGGAPCMMISGPSCVTIPSQGMTTPFMGSS